MHAGLFDVFHHTGDHDALAIANGIDIDFDGIFQEAVDQHRLTLRDDEGLGDEAFELDFVRSRFPWPARQAQSWAAQSEG